MKFPSDKEDFLVEIYILLSLVLLGPYGREEKVRNKLNNRSSVTIFWAMPHPGYLVRLVIESNYVLISAWYIPHLVQSTDCICEEIVEVEKYSLFPHRCSLQFALTMECPRLILKHNWTQ